jgi:hypothetical protein
LREGGNVAGHENAAIGQKDGVVQGVVKTCSGVTVAVNFYGDFVLVVAQRIIVNFTADDVACPTIKAENQTDQ